MHGLFIVIRSLYQAAANAIKLIFTGYTKILVGVARFSFKKGFLGDLLLCVTTIVWMFWPLGIFFVNGYLSLKISSVIVSGIFMFTGYLKITKEWEAVK